MLRTAAGASAAGAAGLVASGALAAIPAAAAARPDRPAERTGHSGATTAADADRTADGPLVIHVRDARTGEMDVFEGTAHTRVRDPELAARLARASR